VTLRFGHVLVMVALLFALHAAAYADNELFTQARALLADGQAQASYELLVEYEADLAGTPEYDYLLGISALDSGRPTHAIFALERVLAVSPEFAPARAEIARAFLAVGEIDTAKETFIDAGKSPDIPQQARANIQRYLDIIDMAGAETDRTRVTGYLGAGAGYDSNVNAATDDRGVAIPAFGGAPFILDDPGIEQSSAFGNIMAGININTPLSPSWRLLASARGKQKLNANWTEFNQGNYLADLGLSYLFGKHSFTVAGQYDAFRLGTDIYRNAYGATGQWRYAMTPDRYATAYIQASNLRYPDQEIRNAKRYIAGGAYSQAFGAGRRYQAYLGIYGGTENNDNPDQDFQSHDIFGARVGANSIVSPGYNLMLNLNYERRSYGADEPLFFETRNDKFLDLRLALDYTGWRKWSVMPYLSYHKNNSNIVINDYDRWIGAVEIRRDFR
jgi:tetratricopeptide (TPR) repeat protein